jgi:hypothetical protein
MHGTTMRFAALAMLAGLLGSCGSAAPSEAVLVPSGTVSRVSFEYVAGHLMRVPVVVGSMSTHFIFDTGIGVNLISQRLCAQLGCAIQGSYTGRRMSGQAIPVQMAEVAELTVAGERHQHVPVGVIDLAALGLDDLGVDGFVSLSFFRHTAVTVDYPRSEIVIESSASLTQRDGAASSAAVRVVDDGPSTTVFLRLTLGENGECSASVEVDSGSSALILDPRYLECMHIDLAAPGVRTVQGRDETGFAFERHFLTLATPVAVAEAPTTRTTDLPAMFQPVIDDGLVGDAMLRRFTVTYDLPHSRMLFAAHATQ